MVERGRHARRELNSCHVKPPVTTGGSDKHCAPNDLFDWAPGKDTLTAEDQPLQTLKRGDAPKNITDIVKNLPLDKLDKVEALLQQLKEED